MTTLYKTLNEVYLTLHFWYLGSPKPTLAKCATE